MTNTEQLLLAMCVGSVAGYAIGNLAYLAYLLIAAHREKKRRKEREAKLTAGKTPLDIS